MCRAALRELPFAVLKRRCPLGGLDPQSFAYVLYIF